MVLLRGCGPTVCDAVLACLGGPVAALLADDITSAFVFVVGGDIAGRGVQAHPVVFGPDAV
jgi:hypothetical protein